MQTTVTLTTRQLGLIHYAASSTYMTIFGELEEGINQRDMSDAELRQTFKELGKLSQLFKDLHHTSWTKDMEEKDRVKHGTQPKTT